MIFTALSTSSVRNIVVTIPDTMSKSETLAGSAAGIDSRPAGLSDERSQSPSRRSGSVDRKGQPKPNKWSFGVLNDKYTDEVPGK